MEQVFWILSNRKVKGCWHVCRMISYYITWVRLIGMGRGVAQVHRWETFFFHILAVLITTVRLIGWCKCERIWFFYFVCYSFSTSFVLARNKEIETFLFTLTFPAAACLLQQAPNCRATKYCSYYLLTISLHKSHGTTVLHE